MQLPSGPSDDPHCLHILSSYTVFHVLRPRFRPPSLTLFSLDLSLTIIKKLWQAFIVRVFPGTLEEYYAAREIHFREQRKYRRTTQHIVGAVLFLAPVFLLPLLGYMPLGPWGVFVFLLAPATFLFPTPPLSIFVFCFSGVSVMPLPMRSRAGYLPSGR